MANGTNAPTPQNPANSPSVTPGSPPPGPPPKPPEHMLVATGFNRLNLDYRTPMLRPPVRGNVIDIHTHLNAARHAPAWFDAADHYGIHTFFSMTPLEEALKLQRERPGRVHFIAIPFWTDVAPGHEERWARRIEAFANLGSRMCKFHCSPGLMRRRGFKLDSPLGFKLMALARERGMAFLSHVGDPETWYQDKYAKPDEDGYVWGTRAEHTVMWEAGLKEHRDWPWVGAHMGGNPENLPALQRLLDTYPNLYLDLSATKWVVREVSAQRDAAREFVIRNADRLLFGTDQVSTDDRGFDFYASRFWAHRKLWETAYDGPSNIDDPDLPPDTPPVLRGLALPDSVLQKVYRDNAVKLMARVGVHLA